ncbi:MAG: thioredoxin domain-containing protein [Deltaproteobacteria bacterium]|nr:thioredoxin domain-containing protein [Deltaproteobacteria bacterium]NIS76363.1 thioredoxin domain-containing protein [Deltaproteobacteria bacterium]
MPVLEQVLEKYPKEVKLIFKNFPLRMHKFAAKAALAALAAKEQGKFWEYHDLLYANFNSLNDEKILSLARGMGLDMERFEKSMADPGALALVNRDMQEGVGAGVRGTPTIFVNGKLLRDRSFNGFQAAIEKELKKAK